MSWVTLPVLPKCESFACCTGAQTFASVSNILLPAGSALVDTGAGHPTCGSVYFERIETELNRCGIKSIVIPTENASIPVHAKGVGGVACTKEVRLVPMRLGNMTVFVEMLILDNEVPPLLSATLLDRCIVDLQRNVIVWN